MAKRVVDAVRNEHTDFLLTLVDPSGISIGFDTPKMGAARFRKELSENRGVYCVIFDSCPRKNGKQARTDPSLRGLLVNHRVSMVLQGVEKAPDERAVAIQDEKIPSEVFFTLFFRHAGNHWFLHQIEYE